MNPTFPIVRNPFNNTYDVFMDRDLPGGAFGRTFIGTARSRKAAQALRANARYIYSVAWLDGHRVATQHARDAA